MEWAPQIRQNSMKQDQKYLTYSVINQTSEWQTNVHRDSYASYVGHPSLVEHFSIGLGQPQAMVRTRFIDVSPFNVLLQALTL